MRTARKKILVADLDEEVLIALEGMLEDQGFETSTAWTGSDALGLLQSRRFDLVLISEHLPDARCEDILNVLRQSGARIPCIVMQPRTAMTSDSTALRALGVCDTVCKREYRQIVQVVSQWLGGGTTAADSTDGGRHG